MKNVSIGSSNGLAGLRLQIQVRTIKWVSIRPVQRREWRKGGKEISVEAMQRFEKWENDGLKGNFLPPELAAKQTQGVPKITSHGKGD